MRNPCLARPSDTLADSEDHRWPVDFEDFAAWNFDLKATVGATIWNRPESSWTLETGSDLVRIKAIADELAARIKGERRPPPPPDLDIPSGSPLEVRGLATSGILRGKLTIVEHPKHPHQDSTSLTVDRGRTFRINRWTNDQFPQGDVWALVQMPHLHMRDEAAIVWCNPDTGPLVIPRYADNPVVSLGRYQVTVDLAQCLDLRHLGVSRDDIPYALDTLTAYLTARHRLQRSLTDDGRSAEEWLRALFTLDRPAEPVPMPAPRLVKSHRAAEEYAAEVMRALGFPDAQTTGAGSDGGIDVVSRNAVAQVKMEAKPTGRPVIQNLAGVAAVERKQGIFFSLAGYTPHALDWAERAGLACWEFEFDGSLTPRTGAARVLATAPDSAAAPTEDIGRPPRLADADPATLTALAGSWHDLEERGQVET